MGVVLQLKHVIETNLMRLSQRCIICYFQCSNNLNCKNNFKKLCISYNMKCFSYKGVCGILILRHVKEELIWAIHTINILMLLVIVIMLFEKVEYH